MITKLRYSSSRETGNTFYFFLCFPVCYDNKFALQHPPKVTDGLEVFSSILWTHDLDILTVLQFIRKDEFDPQIVPSLASRVSEFGSCELDFFKSNKGIILGMFSWEWWRKYWALTVMFRWRQRPVPARAIEGPMGERIKLLIITLHGA